MATESIEIYQFKIHLKGISPQIIRRIQVRSDTTLVQLHGIVQEVMGWCDEHLHRFHIHGRDYGIGYAGGLSFRDNPREVRLSDFGFLPGEYFTYEYNFFCCWVHVLRLEKVLVPNARRSYPFCLASRRVPPSAECREGSELYDVVSNVLLLLEKRDEDNMDFYRFLLNESLDRALSSRGNVNARLSKRDHAELENYPAGIVADCYRNPELTPEKCNEVEN